MHLPDDPRYQAFVMRYAFDLSAFSVQVCKTQPTWQQQDLLHSVTPPGSRTSVRSGHGSGKSRSLAIIALWHLLCYPKSNTLITAPKIEQVRNVAWKEMTDVRDLMLTCGHPWIVDYFVIEAERVYVKGFKQQWFVFAKTAPRGNPENLAGMHRDWYLIIADEASGIPDPNYAVMTGALTDSRNRMLMLSQPTRASGFFYETHHKLSMDSGGVWDAIHMDSRESPLVSKSFISEKREEYTDEEFTIKVLGEFPELRDGFLLGRNRAESCFGKTTINRKTDQYGIIISVDVGAGEYRDKSVVMVAFISGHGDFGADARRVEIIDVPVCSNSIKIADLVGRVVDIYGQYSNATVLVDFGGMGVAVCQSLEAIIGDVVRVKWGVPCFQQRNRDRFFNMRSQATVSASRAAKEGRLGIAIGFWKRDLLDQMSRIPYHYDERARYVVEKKEEMRKQGIPSPDLWDTGCFFFLEGVTYSIAEIGDAGELAALSERVADMYDDL